MGTWKHNFHIGTQQLKYDSYKTHTLKLCMHMGNIVLLPRAHAQGVKQSSVVVVVVVVGTKIARSSVLGIYAC